MDQPNEVGATSAIVDDAALLQREFNSLKDSLSRVKLPEELKLVDSKQGIKSKDQPALNIITRCARYAETALKVIATQPEDLKNIYLVLAAQINFLHGEYAGLLVNSTFYPETFDRQ